MTYYQILEVSEQANQEEIKEAFKKLRIKYEAENNLHQLQRLREAYRALLPKPEVKKNKAGFNALLLTLGVALAILVPHLLVISFDNPQFYWLWFVYIVLMITYLLVSSIIKLLLFVFSGEVKGFSKRTNITQRDRLNRKRTISAFLLIAQVIPVTVILWSFVPDTDLAALAGASIAFYISIGIALYDPITSMIAARRGKSVSKKAGRKALILSMVILAFVFGYFAQYLPEEMQIGDPRVVIAVIFSFLTCSIISLMLELWKMAKR
ncbi:hypothetical protein BKI52_24930 [marine bacterium AO1-C]|nr:hypothetical protein BKI52_24930 [marine bacterium AO1-C]